MELAFLRHSWMKRLQLTVGKCEVAEGKQWQLPWFDGRGQKSWRKVFPLQTTVKKLQVFPNESTLPEIGIQIYYGKAKMCNVTGVFAPDEGQITTWWVSFLRGGGFVQRRLQSRGSKGDKCRYAKQGGKGGNKMWNLLTHCNHQAEASGVVAVQGKSRCLPFRRTKWCFPSTVKSCVTEGGW